MTLASKEMLEKKKQKERIQDRNTNTNGVVITIYEESVTPRSRKQSQDSIKKTKSHPHFTRPRAAPTTHGYDRRAQLLAHSRQLRNYAASEKVPLPTIQSETKSKRKGFWLTKPVRICSCSPSRYMPLPSSSRCRYERVASEESKERNRSKNRKSSRKACPSFLRKVKNMLKELSCKEI